MKKNINDLFEGYLKFKQNVDHSKLLDLHLHGQKPKALVISCCDSRVDPALLFQCGPGDLFIVRNIANIVPPYKKELLHHGISSALEFGIKALKINNIIILGHSQCGGVKAWMENQKSKDNRDNSLEFVNNWISTIDVQNYEEGSVDDCAKLSLINSYKNCLTFPWIKDKVDSKELGIHLLFFDIETCRLLAYDHDDGEYKDVERE